MKPETPKETRTSFIVVIVSVIFAGMAAITFMLHPSVYAGLALAPAAYGVRAFIKDYYPRQKEEKNHEEK